MSVSRPSTAPGLPSLPGGYALELHLNGVASVQVGRMGLCRFPPGCYLYLGSARGPGGLRARLLRHLRPTGAIRLHWHIDYLRLLAPVTALAWLSETAGAPLALECCWSQALAALPMAFIPVPGFGAADCRSGCPAHLVGLNVPPDCLSAPPIRAALADCTGVAAIQVIQAAHLLPGATAGVNVLPQSF